MTAVYMLQRAHREALEWFERNAGQEFDERPFDVGLEIKVTSLQKGIWKPAGIPYAVSVVQTRKGVYDDQDPIFNTADGTWEYYYHQQGKTAEDLRNPESIFANAALLRCRADGVPVGVIIPSDGKSGYQVLGLALVEGFKDGFFRLVGPATIGTSVASDAAEPQATVSVALVEFPLEPFDPNLAEDNRLRVIRAVHQRQGTPRFRRALLQAYEGRCAMTRYDAEPALEAAHIVPYRGPQTNHPTNGLLLRADMHDLFDLGLIAVRTENMTLGLAPELAGTMYEQYDGSSLWIPHDQIARPNMEALDKHRRQSAVA